MYRTKSYTWIANWTVSQVGSIFYPIKLFKENSQFTTIYYLSKLKLIGVKIVSKNPLIQSLELDRWHIYRIEWSKEIKFYIDDEKIATIYFGDKDINARADVWIDNAVFVVNRNDAGKVYRHNTQENRRTAILEVDYIAIY